MVACSSGGTGSSPGLGRFHVWSGTKLCAATTEPPTPRACAPPQLEKAHVRQQRPSTAKNK